MPFKSKAQQGYLHAHPEILGKAGLKEWDAASKGKKLPKKVKVKKGGNTTLKPDSMKAEACDDRQDNIQAKKDFLRKRQPAKMVRF